MLSFWGLLARNSELTRYPDESFAELDSVLSFLKEYEIFHTNFEPKVASTSRQKLVTSEETSVLEGNVDHRPTDSASQAVTMNKRSYLGNIALCLYVTSPLE